MKNKSGISRDNSSPTKAKSMISAVTLETKSPAKQREYSPLKTEILNDCDMSVNIKPLQAEHSIDASATRNRRQANASSVTRSSKREAKARPTINTAQIELLKKNRCAQKIQRYFRAYLEG